MEIRGSIALVTGANRGIGRAFVEALQMGDATRIYAAARNVSSLADLAAGDPQRIVPIPLDITDLDQVGDAAKRCGDVNLLINNAGILFFAGVIAAALDAQYEAIIGKLTTEPIVSMLTTTPPPLATRIGANARHIAIVPK